MELYRIAFIGHREIYEPYRLSDIVEDLAKELLRAHEYVEFLIGRNGDFDILAASAVKRAQKSCEDRNSALILIQPYKMKDDEYYESYYDEICFPISPKTHPKAAITKRNQWMIDQADLLVAYVERDRKGGALTALKYAKKRNVRIFNLAEK